MQGARYLIDATLNFSSHEQEELPRGLGEGHAQPQSERHLPTTLRQKTCRQLNKLVFLIRHGVTV